MLSGTTMTSKDSILHKLSAFFCSIANATNDTCYPSTMYYFMPCFFDFFLPQLNQRDWSYVLTLQAQNRIVREEAGNAGLLSYLPSFPGRQVLHALHDMKWNDFDFDTNDFSIFRQFIARTVLDTLRLVTDLPDDVEAVLKVMNKLADDLGKWHTYTLHSIVS